MDTKEIFLIRHGRTSGNLEKRYVGRYSDEPLCDEGIEEILRIKDFIPCEDFALLSGGMERCCQTTQLLFPGRPYAIVTGISEMDFGDFEGKNYAELSGDEGYQAWIDSNGTLPFPGGESREGFIYRTMTEFSRICKMKSEKIVLICHGGNIMAIMSRLFGGDYFDYQVGCLQGYKIRLKVGEHELTSLSYDRVCPGNNT